MRAVTGAALEPDAIFAEPRLAAIYDLVDDDRSDLDAYEAIVDELGATSVLDIGCGTGTLACRLALRGLDVVGLDPAAASLDVARRKPGADRVRWVHGGPAALPDVADLAVDLAVMTGNVAQVFLTDVEWAQVLAAAAASLGDGGWLVFEARDPSRRAWESWTREHTHRELDLPGVGRVTTWTDLLDVAPPFVAFRHSYRFASDGELLESDSTLRFRTQDELLASVAAAGLDVREVRDAPDRPGRELVVLARKG